jgi:hypothetical protein
MASPQESEAPEFLYRPMVDWDGDIDVGRRRVVDRWIYGANRHRIVKKTAQRIYVERDPYDEERWAKMVSEGAKPKTIIIPRWMLESRDPKRIRLHCGLFTTAEEAIRFARANSLGGSESGWCSVLGVTPPCSVDDIKAAYRRLAKESHPDAGGDATAFMALEQAYRDALAYCQP